jgi:Flp pilus assembly protein TadD
MFLLLVTAGAALALILGSELIAGGSLRTTFVAAAPAILLAIPILQSLPLPSRFQNRLDPAGAELITGSPQGDRAFRPYSLDPPATRNSLGQAAAALAVFLVAAHVASGRSFRHVLLRVIVCAGIAAVVVGLGHRILGEARIYGTFEGGRAILNGPFVNPNHTAQFLELTFFVALALAYARASTLNRVGWLAAAAFLVAGALGTLSRGGVLALAVAGMVFLAFRNTVDRDVTTRNPRTSLFWIGLVLALMVIVAGSLGASQLLAKFAQSNVTQDTRFRLWLDSFQLVIVHPFGIGRGAFERVYPTVRSIEGGLPVRFSFAENEPLQLLVETGWLGFAAIVAGAVLMIRTIYRHGRHDRIELALVCGLLAVFTHNLVDFGLETLGLLLPTAAVAGMMMGRTKGWNDRLLSRRAILGFSAAAMAGILVGVASLAHSSGADFDARIRSAQTPIQRRELALKAQAVHPVDYFYLLTEALTLPVFPASDGHSPRLRILNRALRMCPSCPEVHTEVARSLWALGKRQQALSEWRIAIATRPTITAGILEEVWKLGANPDEVAALGGNDPGRLVEVASFLRGKSARNAARKVINSALMVGASPVEVSFLRAQLNLDDGLVGQALQELSTIEKIAPNDPRAFALRADAVLRTGDAPGALDVLDKGVAVNPYDLPLQRRRLQLVIENQKWSRAQAALEGLEIALFHVHQSTTEVHLAAAQVATRLGDNNRAIAEYRTAVNENGKDPWLWMALGGFCETLGRDEEALRAFLEAQRLAPGHQDIATAIERITTRRRQLDAAATRRNILNGP